MVKTVFIIYTWYITYSVSNGVPLPPLPPPPQLPTELCSEEANVIYHEPSPRQYDEYEDNNEPQHQVNSITITCSTIDLDNEPLPPSVRRYECLDCPNILLIKNSTIPNLPPSYFISYSSTTILYIKNSGVEKILPGAFNSLNSLNELYLSNNNLTIISDGIFNSLINLRILDLSQNKIQNLSTHSFTGVSNLEVLNLSSNGLQYFDSYTLLHTKLLVELDLSFNQLGMYNFSLISSNVQNLNISNNCIKNIFGCFATLTMLDASRNLLTTLDNGTCLGKNTAITRLDLGHNVLTSVKGVQFLNQLHYLSLEDNELNSIPNELFAQLKQLTFLNLSSNQLQEFQYGLFDSLSNLNTLDVSHNRLIAFKTFSYHLLQGLEKLYVQNNEISDFDTKDITRILPNLENLSLNGNNFTCTMLLEVFHNLRGISVHGGNSFNTSNINGIACSDIEFNLDLPAEKNSNNNSTTDEILRIKLIKLFNSDFTKSSMYNYFNTDFKKSNFYKYLENLNFFGNVSINNYEKNLNNIRNVQKSQDDFNRNVTNYFNNDFKKSNFVKYLESFKGSENMLNNGFNKSTMYNYFDKGFENSKFYKYLEALKKPQFVIKYSEDANNTKVEKLVSTFADVEAKSDNSALLVVIIVVLVIISCIMLCFMYATYSKFEKIFKIRNEQVELIDT